MIRNKSNKMGEVIRKIDRKEKGRNRRRDRDDRRRKRDIH